ncbi:MAG: diguanylate cyclase [Ruminococcaceae bacterium]|nr:diguanylate cyclase [Oscillospiraceae bacterium]
MNEIIRAMEERRSIRSFKPEMPPKEVLQQIVEAGLYAASGKGRQAAIVVAVTNKALRDKLAEENRRIAGAPEGSDPFYGAPAVLVVLGRKDWPTHVYDGSLVMGNLLLAAHALGLGSIWIHRAKEEFEEPEYQQLLKDLGVEGEWEGIGHCAVGYLNGEAPAPAPRKPGRVFWAE